MARLRGMVGALLALVLLPLGVPPAGAIEPAPSATPPGQSAIAPAQLSVVPASGRSGTLVTISSDLVQTLTTCTLEQDGIAQQTFLCGPKSTFRYTVTGAPGRHTLAVCAPACIKVAAVPSAAAEFVVLAVVPRLIGLAESSVPKALAAAGLRLGSVTGPRGSPVLSQDPPSGSVVDPDTSVNVGLGPPVTTTVRSRVNVRFVVVPDLRGDSLDRARAALAGVGLTLSTGSTSGTVATQSPRPGRLVAAGSTVTVTVELAVSTTSSSKPPRPGYYWEIAIALLVLVALAGGYTARRLRHRRPAPRPTIGPPPRVTCRTTADVVHTKPTGPAAPTIDLRVREHLTLTMERKP